MGVVCQNVMSQWAFLCGGHFMSIPPTWCNQIQDTQNGAHEDKPIGFVYELYLFLMSDRTSNSRIVYI